MDLNDLYARHQIAVMRAAGAPGCDTRHAHLDAAAGYARAITAFRARFDGQDAIATVG